MHQRLQRHGNSRAIVVRQAILDLLSWDDNTILEVAVENDKLIFQALMKPRKKSLFEKVGNEKETRS
jgi:antitoxin component of MazEF toxin-antitoxin module